MDAHKNFARSTVATAPSPAMSGTSLVVASGDGALFPAVAFNATVWPAGAQPTNLNAEIVRVTVIATDTFTITRTQESTSARTIVVGDQIAATVTNKTLTDIEAMALGGDVVGPASAVASEGVLFDGTTGKLLKRATGTGVVHRTSGVDSVSAVVEADQTLADNTTRDVSTSMHGYAPKAPGDATKFLNGANPPAYAVPGGGGAMTLIGEADGTDATAAATNVATFAISGLTIKDSLLVIIRHSSVTQLTNEPLLYNATDSVAVCRGMCDFANIAAGIFASATVVIGCDPSTITRVVSCVNVWTTGGGSPGVGVTNGDSAVFTTNFTGSWTLALRTGVNGVVAGGTYRYRISVFKVAGQ